MSDIPPAVMAFVAERAHARQMIVVDGALHALMRSNPAAVAEIIERAVMLD